MRRYKEVLPIGGYYVCRRCGKAFDDLYRAGGHLGVCRGLKGLSGVDNALNHIDNETRDEWVKGLALLGLVFIAGILLLSGEKKKGGKK